ncbi:putative methyltransferase-domain-containing protein [Peziza echinospora]|nr:putative methyltransferase-domain-containing protein [Peziza echinospora]
MGRVKKTARTRSALLSGNRHKAAAVGLSSKASRTLINRHHTLEKRLTQALARNDLAAAQAIQTDIDANGGLERYQQASISGQSQTRGGDSSKILMEWIHDTEPISSQSHKPSALQMLEVGALSIDNACSKSSMFKVTRIDLHSQHPDILSQDFMKRPLPTAEDEKFDIISLSLVLNYVPSPTQRGEMLKRTTQFLRRRDIGQDKLSAIFPSLFLVLPAPCVTNSRYMDEVRLATLMGSLGYTQVRRKLSSKLIYHLWAHNSSPENEGAKGFKKEEVNPGPKRNNFAIVLE